MKRFFFDVSSCDHTHYDYQGRDFARQEQAEELAELIALDLQCSDNGGWAGSQVQVRNIGGTCLFSIPIGEAELIAA
ncbi:MAG TPA: hypothetical protein VNQ50_05725 [Xanthobacteraceae bacterium]|jgi:hypothetical protein|nr:hypothetical protein [Xanthobacteraceae bacterium]